MNNELKAENKCDKCYHLACTGDADLRIYTCSETDRQIGIVLSKFSSKKKDTNIVRPKWCPLN